ncbi:MAG: inorganic diphosphatase, partial [Bacteroidota bacterium]
MPQSVNPTNHLTTTFILMKFIAFPLLILLSCWSCEPSPANGLTLPSDPDAVASIENDALNVIVEIPAGTNHKVEYKAGKGFRIDTLGGGLARIVNFLPYPGNYGFVPSTLMDRERGGDGDPLDVLVLCESLPTGTKIATKPIAVLLL